MHEDDTIMMYQALQQAYVLLDDGDRRALNAIGLTPTQYSLLLKLAEPASNGATITELSQALLCTRGNMTRLVRRLESQALVQCSGDSRDQRLVRVSLTPDGSARLAAAHAAHVASIQRRLGAFDDTSHTQLCRLMEQLVALLKADLATQVSPPVPAQAKTRNA
jgi:DNA-binding MarR family transcriptional regulator